MLNDLKSLQNKKMNFIVSSDKHIIHKFSLNILKSIIILF